ncbi:MAG: Spy/CpxP family protein refolding chaperone [Xanthomonadales bacterium]|nr:Spy/CpxP family protein refolding chaperone [Xanthomonadales bacterium]ODU94785.1 MAG: hypothetical protein ABT18_02140 [Rhodanobacter sp. SCN 66-43]OJY82772.1 MAG: hypothetical protein BGP23_06600 [Xanthomonadales bacterium 66-474]
MRKTFLVSAIFAAAIGCAPLTATIAQGAPGAGWHGHHGMAMGSHMYDKLNLTDAQRDQIKQLTQQSFSQAKSQRQTLREARQAYESAVPGSADYQTAAGKLGEAEADAARARVARQADLRAQIHQVLTPAQRDELVQIRQQRQARMQQWKESRQQNPSPPSASSSAPSVQ